ncbi:MAG: hypothetical protein NZ484_00190 [Patescibacteria group bacterium]|nr:hypothetical protein [Patescibacteria group bacterium]MDW8279598.1 hypothetical protein [bacterium]
MIKPKLKILIVLNIVLFSIKKTLAVCPLCVIAVAGGLELSRLLKIDDLITGLWVGGLIVALIYWTIDFLIKKNINFKFRNLLIILIWYAFVGVGIYFAKINSEILLNLQFLNKLNLGIILGSLAFWFGAETHQFLKQKNNKSYFPFQKVVMPIIPILILSIIFYILLK